MADGSPDAGVNDIAIIGLALRVPGASNAVQFWDNLRGGVESIETRTPEQLSAAGETPERIRRRNYVPCTAELPGMADFDAEFFGFSPKDAAVMDPQHRHFLECAWEAMEDATRPPERTSGPVGVFAGCGMGSYFYFNVCSHRPLVDQVGMFLLRHTGNDKDFLATRASYLFDLHGPSVNVQTACSTSLVAIHYACQSLLSGECEMALAGGVTIELPHGHGYLYQEGEILAPDGHCRAFDHRAAGTVFGSGVGVVVLRRLADALADGDPIRAVIKATAINNDGAGKASYLAPSVTGQAEAIVEAHGLAGVGAETIQYVECHGTGTNLGDPIEIEALTQAFRQSTDKSGYCRIGSVKTNIGHLDTAAGVVSLIKATLALQHGEIPPSLGYEKPNPAIDFAASPFVVNDKLTPWPRAPGPRRAGVNSLGVGGTNAHAVLEEAPKSPLRAVASVSGPQILALSAKSRRALEDACHRLADHLQAHPQLALADVAKTLVEGRKRFEHRRVVAVADRADAIAALSKPELRRTAAHTAIDGVSGAVLMFPGGGAQYPGMGAALYRSEPDFARTVDEGLSYLPAALAARLRDLWLGQGTSKSDAAEQLLQPSLQLPAILVIEVALARLWQNWGLKPAALIGHSMGEYAAACIAGVMSFERAVQLVQLRGQLFDEITGGGMLSVPLPADTVRARLPATLDIGVVNAPEMCVVSGPNAEIESFRQALVTDGVDAARVPINIAAHSRMLEPILARFEGFLRATPLAAPRIPIVSNLTGTWLKPDEATDPLYWVKHLRSTVRFAEGMATLAADRARVYIEAGPGRTLSSLAKAQGCIEANAVINTLPHADEQANDSLYFLTAVGRAWAVGLELPIGRLWAAAKAGRVRLPAYPFQHQRYFLDRVVSTQSMQGNEAPAKRPDMATWGWRPAWKPAYAETSPHGDRTPGAFLVFLDDGGPGAGIVARLRAAGHRVCTVAIGDTFAALSPEHVTLCPEHGRDGYDALVRHFAAHGGMPGNILHLWLLTSDERFRPGSSFFHRNQERGFYSLFFLAQSLGELDPPPDLQITFLTNGMQRVGDEALPYPDKATVLGPAQVLPREMPNVHVRVVDVPADERGSPGNGRNPPTQMVRIPDWLRQRIGASPSVPIADLVWDDLFAAPGNEIVAHRGARRWVRHHQAVPLPELTGIASRFRENGVYLITGGLGDLALTLAVDLARRYRARIALLGRMDLPDRAEWPRYLSAYGRSGRIGQAIAAILSVEEAGGHVHYVRADVTNAEAMRRAIAGIKDRFGALHGVLHAAGVIKDELIALKAPGDIEDVLAPKVFGTMVLHEALAGEPLDVLVLFSSTSTDTAPAGQVDYVAANAYLNAFADSRFGRGGPLVAAVHWGIWSDVGLAARAIAQAEQSEPVPAVETTSQPLFDQRVGVEGQGEWLELRCEPARQWLLDEHRLRSGEAVWPGTGYLELVAEAAREFGIWGAIEIQDLTFVRPLHVADGDVRAVRVRMDRDGQRLKLAVESRAGVGDSETWVRHAEATASALRRSSPPALDIASVLATCRKSRRADEGQTLRSAQDAHLRFGPRWQVLREIHFGEGVAMAKLQLAAPFTGDLEHGLLLHPALMDIATGYAMELIGGYDPANGLWVPATYGRVVLHRPLPATIWSRARLAPENDLGPGFAVFDVTILDEHGHVLAEVEGFTVKHLGKHLGKESGSGKASLLEAGLPDPGARTPHKAMGLKEMRELSPAMQRLAAQVANGIGREEGFEALERALGTGLPQIVVSSMDLALLQKAMASTATAPGAAATLERPNIDSDFVAPATETEKTLAGFWSELLGIDRIGIQDSFFDLGGHSLVAVRLFRMIKKAFAVDLPISVLFEAPTIAQCAQLIEQAGGGVTAQIATKSAGTAPVSLPARTTHLVRMQAGKQAHATPLFVCAGMFGNILNLRHLAVQMGQDRPVYGLQARGLYGDQAPHETFEEMARDYLVEVRSVQPHGPYLLSGFSGGGLVAYEMAQQLLAAGETVASLVLLDTPYPETVVLSRVDRLAIRFGEIRQQKGAFFGRYLRHRIGWELERRRQVKRDEQITPEQFHNGAIEAAFRRALGRYRARAYGSPVVLLRPKLKIVYRLRDGRLLNIDRNLAKADNGWSPFIANLSIIEVPGDHDSMVLEPNVRVLAGHMREIMKSAWRTNIAVPAAAE
jgi:acyl transferase domain-containing protein